MLHLKEICPIVNQIKWTCDFDIFRILLISKEFGYPSAADVSYLTRQQVLTGLGGE